MSDSTDTTNNTTLQFDLSNLITTNSTTTTTNKSNIENPYVDNFALNNTVRLDGALPMTGTFKSKDIELQGVNTTINNIEKESNCVYMGPKNEIGTWRFKQTGTGTTSKVIFQVCEEKIVQIAVDLANVPPVDTTTTHVHEHTHSDNVTHTHSHEHPIDTTHINDTASHDIHSHPVGSVISQTVNGVTTAYKIIRQCEWKTKFTINQLT